VPKSPSAKETTVTLHTIPAVSGHRRPRLALAATLAAVTCAASGAIAIGSSGEQPFAQLSSFADGGQPSDRYYDIEANKANSMRALGRHLDEQRANGPSRYDDLEANKARSLRAR
jgi:hypothetical protein